MNNYFLRDVSLRFFEGEGGTSTGETTASPAPTRQGKQTGETILYGKQPDSTPDAGEETQEAEAPTLEERRKAYQDLISGEYKDFYTEDTQKLIDRRFRAEKTTQKAMQDQLDSLQPIMELLAQRYNVADKDPAKIMQAVESDNDYWSAAAEQANMDVDHYKAMQKLQRENAALREAERRREGADRANQFMQRVAGEALELQKVYPSFNLQAELDNPAFRSMLKSGVPMQHAFEVLHIDAVKAGIAASSAKATEQQLAAKVRQNGARPVENGASSQSAFTVKDDVSKLTKKDRAEIAKRVMRGEDISF